MSRFLVQVLHLSYIASCHKTTLNSFLAGSIQLPICGGTDPPGVLQGNSGRQRYGTVVEEIHLQDNLPTRWSCSRIFQVTQLSGATGIVAGVTLGSRRRSAAARIQLGLLPDERILTASTLDTILLVFSILLRYARCCISLPLSSTSSWLLAVTVCFSV